MSEIPDEFPSPRVPEVSLERAWDWLARQGHSVTISWRVTQGLQLPPFSVAFVLPEQVTGPCLEWGWDEGAPLRCASLVYPHPPLCLLGFFSIPGEREVGSPPELGVSLPHMDSGAPLG